MLTKPFWPMLHRTLNFSAPALNPVVPRFRLQHIGQGFQTLVSFGITQEAHDVFQSMSELTITIDSHVRGSGQVWDFANLIDWRNVVQHRLMSLPTGQEIPYGEVSNVLLYEAVRHAAIIFRFVSPFALEH